MAQGAQLEDIIYVKTDTDEFLLHGRPCEVSANAFVPPSRPIDKNRNAFNVERQVSTTKPKNIKNYCIFVFSSVKKLKWFCFNS